MKQAMLQTITMLNKFAKEAGVTEPSLLNFVVTDGHAVIATRYISSRTDEAASLYFRSVIALDLAPSGVDLILPIDSTGTSFEEVPAGSGTYRMQKYDKRESIILIASVCLLFNLVYMTFFDRLTHRNLSHSRKRTGWRFLRRL